MFKGINQHLSGVNALKKKQNEDAFDLGGQYSEGEADQFDNNDAKAVGKLSITSKHSSRSKGQTSQKSGGSAKFRKKRERGGGDQELIRKVIKADLVDGEPLVVIRKRDAKWDSKKY